MAAKRESTRKATKKLPAKSPTKAKPQQAADARSKPSTRDATSATNATDAQRVERLRALCLALPEANERVSHGEPTWFAGKGKVFAMLDNYHHGAEHLAVWLPQPLGVQETLIAAEPERFFRPPYVGPSGWVGMRLDGDPDWTLVAKLLREAYVHVATRKLLAQLTAGVPSVARRST